MLVDRDGFDTSKVDDIVWGTSLQSGTQSGDLGRMAALDAGYDVRSSGVTLDRFCGSGITATNMPAHAVMSGMEDLVIADGTEMMSSYARNRSTTGLMDRGNDHLRAIHPQPHQGVSADVIAHLEGIPRAALDELAAESQCRAKWAVKEGRFDRSLVPVFGRSGQLVLDHEGYPRPGMTIEALALVRCRRRRGCDHARHVGSNPTPGTLRAGLLLKHPGQSSCRIASYEAAGGERDRAPQVLFTWKLVEGRHSSSPHTPLGARSLGERVAKCDAEQDGAAVG